MAINKIAIIYHSESGNTKMMANLIAKGARGGGCEVKTMPVNELELSFIEASRAVLFGSPTYYGTMSWQMKKMMDTTLPDLSGKLGAVFASAGWQGGGGYEVTEMSLIVGMLIKGMLIYSGGVRVGHPPTHFGAVSAGLPKDFDAERCIKLGANIAAKVNELWPR